MDSLKIDVRSASKEEAAASRSDTVDPKNGRSETLPSTRNSNSISKHKKWKRRSSYFPRIGCLRIEEDKEGNFDASVDIDGEPSNPSHLVVMVNGVMGRFVHFFIFFSQIDTFGVALVVAIRKCGLNIYLLFLLDLLKFPQFFAWFADFVVYYVFCLLY